MIIALCKDIDTYEFKEIANQSLLLKETTNFLKVPDIKDCWVQRFSVAEYFSDRKMRNIIIIPSKECGFKIEKAITSPFVLYVTIDNMCKDINDRDIGEIKNVLRKIQYSKK